MFDQLGDTTPQPVSRFQTGSRSWFLRPCRSHLTRLLCTSKERVRYDLRRLKNCLQPCAIRFLQFARSLCFASFYTQEIMLTIDIDIANRSWALKIQDCTGQPFSPGFHIPFLTVDCRIFYFTSGALAQPDYINIIPPPPRIGVENFFVKKKLRADNTARFLRTKYKKKLFSTLKLKLKKLELKHCHPKLCTLHAGREISNRQLISAPVLAVFISLAREATVSFVFPLRSDQKTVDEPFPFPASPPFLSLSVCVPVCVCVCVCVWVCILLNLEFYSGCPAVAGLNFLLDAEITFSTFPSQPEWIRYKEIKTQLIGKKLFLSPLQACTCNVPMYTDWTRPRCIAASLVIAIYEGG